MSTPALADPADRDPMVLRVLDRIEDQRAAAHALWSTEDELLYVDRLGLHRHAVLPDAQVIELLRGYLRGCSRRVEWGNVDGYRAQEHARARLYRLRGGRR